MAQFTQCASIFTFCACSAPAARRVMCEPVSSSTSSSATEALNGGGTTTAYVEMSRPEELAIVQVSSISRSGASASCTGTLVAPTWVLTAGHCAVATDATFIVQFAPDQSQVDVIRTIPNPNADLLLLELAHSAPSGVIPIAFAAALPSTLAGELVQTAGIAPIVDDSPASMSFAVERVRASDDDSFTVTADGYAGACLGDSGGPALSRSGTGQATVWGVLSSGSGSCWGDDTYVRTDTQQDWLFAQLGHDQPPGACGLLDSVGRCFGQRAVWCQDTTEAAAPITQERDCTGTLKCGWSIEAEGYRCVAPTSDPCDGIDDLGTCQLDDAVRCVRGTLERSPCSACGATCARTPTTGQVSCVR
jgi:hypothetical protein